MEKKFRLSIVLRPEDYESLQQAFANTTCKTLTEYSRKVVLGKPVVVTYRELSFDDFVETYLRLRKDLDVLLANAGITETEKQRLFEEIILIKETCIKIYDYVRQIQKHQGHC